MEPALAGTLAPCKGALIQTSGLCAVCDAVGLSPQFAALTQPLRGSTTPISNGFFWSGIMAIYHFSVQVISRADGRSAVAAAAYRAAEKIADQRTGTVADFTKKNGVASTHILLPADAPADYADRSILWNAVERAETRKNSQVAREINIALPVELNPQRQRDLILGFVQSTFVDAGMVADVAIHDVDSGNPHAHVMLTTRNVDGSGFTTKNRDWNDRDTLKKWREQWAEHANNALEQAGHAERIDHRTLAAQGITDREPTVHLGPARHAMQRRGVTLESVAPQLERQRLRRAAQDAAAAKIAEAAAQARVDFLAAQLDDIQAQRRQNNDERIRAIRAAITAAERGIIDVREQITAAERHEHDVRRRISRVTADTARGEKLVRQQREKIEAAEQEQRQLTESIKRARAIAATVGRTVSRAVGAVTGSISGWRERRAEQRRTADAIAAITTEIEQITDAITDAQRQHRSATDADHSIRGRIQSTAARIDDARERISRAAPLAATPDQRRAIERIARAIRTRDPHVIPTREQCHSRAVAEYDQLHAPAQPAPLRRPTHAHAPAPTQYDTPKG